MTLDSTMFHTLLCLFLPLRTALPLRIFVLNVLLIQLVRRLGSF